MQNPPHPTAQKHETIPGPSRAARRWAAQQTHFRRILAVCTALMVLGLVTFACYPGGPVRRADSTPVADPGGLPEQPPPGDTASPAPARPDAEPSPESPPVEAPGDGEMPDPAEPPEQETPQEDEEPYRLPEVPEGEPSRFVVNGDRSCPMIALTYDAGSGAEGATPILNTLKQHGVTSTFFLTGKWVEKYPDLARHIAAEGHEIANHSYSHPDLTKLPPEEVIQQLTRAEEAIREVTGQDPRPLFREPYGAFNLEERELVRQAGYSYSIYWDVDTLDWQFPPIETLVSRILDKARGGSIVLMHLGVPDTAVASDQVIPVLRERGYRLVTVTELLRCTLEQEKQEAQAGNP